MPRFRIFRRGAPAAYVQTGYAIEMDGRPLEDVTKLKLEMNADDIPRVTIEFIATELDVGADVDDGANDSPSTGVELSPAERYRRALLAIENHHISDWESYEVVRDIARAARRGGREGR